VIAEKRILLKTVIVFSVSLTRKTSVLYLIVFSSLIFILIFILCTFNILHLNLTKLKNEIRFTGLDDSESVRYAIHSDEANGYFAIDPVKGIIKTTAVLDHESFESVLLNVKAYSVTNKYYGAHTQVSVYT